MHVEYYLEGVQFYFFIISCPWLKNRYFRFPRL